MYIVNDAVFDHKKEAGGPEGGGILGGSGSHPVVLAGFEVVPGIKSCRAMEAHVGFEPGTSRT